MLLDSFKIYDIVLKVIEASNDLVLMKLIVSTFNFQMSRNARNLLEKCLICSIKPSCDTSSDIRQEITEFRIYVLKLIFNIFRSNILKFNALFIDILINSILVNEIFNPEKVHDFYDLNDQYVLELTVNLIEYFINLRPDLVDGFFSMNIFNKDKIQSLAKLINNPNTQFCLKNSNLITTKLSFLLSRFLLSKKAICEMSLDEIEVIINDWNKKNLDVKYFQLLERNIFNGQAINPSYMDEFDERISPDLLANNEDTTGNANEFIKLYRRINDLEKNHSIYSSVKAQIYIPFHLNSAIIRFEKFRKNGYFINDSFEEKHLESLRVIKEAATQDESFYDDAQTSNEVKLKNRNLKDLKAALWRISSMCNCEDGFKYMSILNSKNEKKMFANLFELMTFVIKIAESYPVLSIRGTAFFCLNYMSKSCTGANLIGKLGWHTFQPNHVVQTKAFYSVLGSFTSEQLDLNNFYSSVATAVVLCNINRSKANIDLKKIPKLSLEELSNEKKEFIDSQNNIDLIKETDEYFVKYEQDLVKIGFFHENISIPIRVNLMSPDINDKITFETSLLNNKCLSCYLKGNEKACHQPDTVQTQIIDLIHQFILMGTLHNLEKPRSNLIKLKVQQADKFCICLHSLVAEEILSSRKVKYHFRKFIQELFIDISLEALCNTV